jgi:glycosyltransferase involved in cell wall biosynthesis
MYTCSLIMIARNEARCIERCLASAQPWVNTMLVVDTGSQDQTCQIAQRCGARVEHFVWVNDFSAARNHAMSLCETDWALVLDADEWLISGMDMLVELKNTAPQFIGQVQIQSEFTQHTANGPQTHHSPSWIPRLLPATVRYQGRIHEQPDTTLPRRRIRLQVGHDGYQQVHMAGKKGRNETLLKQALQEHPDDAYLLYQYGRELEVREHFDEAFAWYQKAYDLTPTLASWRHDLVLRWMFTLKKLQRFDLLAPLIPREIPYWSYSPDFYFTLGDVYLDWALKEPQEAPRLLPLIEQSLLQALKIGEQPVLQDSVAGRGSYLAAHNLSVFYSLMGQPQQAQHWQGQHVLMKQKSGVK